MKKLLALVLVVVMALSMAACAGGSTSSSSADKKIKVGFITLHDENSTYDKNFIEAAKKACAELGIEYVIKTGIDETNDCQVAAADLADSGCNIVFADSFGHEQFLMEVAKEFPNVQFCHATGTNAHTAGLDNLHNAFASIYEGRFLAGVAAGMKLNQMIADGKITADQAVMGYVGAKSYAEVISGYTAFYLGAKYVCPTVTMKVHYTGEWYDEPAEKEAAELLISKGCVLISQHADSMGAPTACETKGVPNISYNGSTIDACPNTFIVSSKIDWVPYFKYMIQCVQKGEKIAVDYVGSTKDGSVVLSDINTAAAAPGTAEKIAEVQKALEAGTLHVFDTATFTVDGAALTSYKADVDSDPAYEPDTEVISDGYFHESEYRSAPYFNIIVDGIEVLNG